jgi:hypothetical protein
VYIHSKLERGERGEAGVGAGGGVSSLGMLAERKGERDRED